MVLCDTWSEHLITLLCYPMCRWAAIHIAALTLWLLTIGNCIVQTIKQNFQLPSIHSESPTQLSVPPAMACLPLRCPRHFQLCPDKPALLCRGKQATYPHFGTSKPASLDQLQSISKLQRERGSGEWDPQLPPQSQHENS